MKALLDRIRADVLDYIPLVAHLDVALSSDDNGNIVARAPLQKNRNHRDTAFAASLNAVATLAGWAMAYVISREKGVAAELVLQKSSIRYLVPVQGDIVAVAERPADKEIDAFVHQFERKHRSRLKVHVTISDGGTLAVKFKGKYATAMQPGSAPP